MHDHDCAIDSRFEARIHQNVRAQLLRSIVSPRAQVNADARNVNDRGDRADIHSRRLPSEVLRQHSPRTMASATANANMMPASIRKDAYFAHRLVPALTPR